jgi:hypothetical protein
MSKYAIYDETNKVVRSIITDNESDLTLIMKPSDRYILVSDCVDLHGASVVNGVLVWL